MPDNRKIACYQERFSLFMGSGSGFALSDQAETPRRPANLAAIRHAIADLRNDLAQINQIIRVLEWLTASSTGEKSPQRGDTPRPALPASKAATKSAAG